MSIPYIVNFDLSKVQVGVTWTRHTKQASLPGNRLNGEDALMHEQSEIIITDQDLSRQR